MSSAMKKFREALQDHKIFQDLELQSGEGSTIDKPDQLMHVYEGSLYVWDNKNSCLNVINLSLLLEDKTTSVQKLRCSPPLTYDVRRIVFNASGTMVALIGKKFASVFVLPERWRQAKHQSQSYCKCLSVAERFFRTSVAVEILEALWHPGSPSDNHLCLLLSDNTLRIYQTSADLQNPVQIHKLGQHNAGTSQFSLASSRFSISSGMGETAVSFAFARPITIQVTNKNVLRMKKTDEIPSAQLYPVYLLQGNGDVLLLLTSVTDSRYRKGVLQGPLLMKPSAEDNYGVDSCSILVLDCTPTVLAIGTSSGKVHHCIALASDDDYDSEDDASEVQSTRSWPASVLSVKNKGAIAKFSAPTLYIYETVELDAEINRGDEEEDKEFVDLAVSLHRDPLLYCRYHCCSKFGIHAVVLPWMDKIASFFEADDDEKDVMDDLSQARPCGVEHIICTKPSSSNSESAVKGVTFATNPLFGPSMLCLTADRRCTVLALLTVLKPVPTPLPIEDKLLAAHLDEDLSPKSIATWDFKQHIQSILQRDYTQPLLRYDASMGETLVNSEACRLVTRVTQIIRKEYILKQKLADDAIVKRADFLKQQDCKQQNDMKTLKERSVLLTDKAGELAEKYEDCRERMRLLSKRLEEIMKLAQSNAHVLSKAEDRMGRDLEMMGEKMKHLKNQVIQVRAKYEYQISDSSVPEKTDTSSLSKSTNPTLVQNFKDVLSEEGKKIEDLVKKLNQMKANLDT